MPLGIHGQIGRASRHRCLLPTLLLLSLSVVPVHRASAEDRSGPARETAGEPSRASVSTEVRPAAPTRPAVVPTAAKLTRIPLPAATPGERAMVMIDGGTPAAKPTDAERRKLETARAAVERARLAGTLYRTRATLGEALPLPSDWEARKRALLRAKAPKPFADDPTAGVGPLPSVQKTGPTAPAEETKRRATPTSSKDRDPNEGGR